MRGWRAFSLIFFALLAGMQFVQVASILVAFTVLDAQIEYQRLSSLAILSTAIAISATVTAFGIYKNKTWTVRAGSITGIILFLYALYEIAAEFFLPNASSAGGFNQGIVYGLFTFLAFWLVRRKN